MSDDPSDSFLDKIGKDTRERFFSMFREENGCLIFSGMKNKAGYGLFWVGGKRRLTHRLAWKLRHGPIENGLLVLHAVVCSSRACAKEEHLRLGTQYDNVMDMIVKGTHPRNGGRPPRLPVESVRWIRQHFRGGKNKAKELAKKLGITWGYVYSIKRGRDRQRTAFKAEPAAAAAPIVKPIPPRSPTPSHK